MLNLLRRLLECAPDAQDLHQRLWPATQRLAAAAFRLCFYRSLVSVCDRLANRLRVLSWQWLLQLLRSDFISDVIYRVSLLLASALGAGYLCARLFEGLPWRSLGLTLHAGWFRDLVIGCGNRLCHTRSLLSESRWQETDYSFSINDAIVSEHRQVNAWIRDVAVRCGPGGRSNVQRLPPANIVTRAQLAWLGVLLTSVPFGFVHLSNPNVIPVVTFVNTVLAGVWLAVAYLRTRSLWLPLGAHWAGTGRSGGFSDVPISGVNLVSNPLLKATDAGPAWLTGGNYGIEGGIACTVALNCVQLSFSGALHGCPATPELKKLTSEENPAYTAARNKHSTC